MADKTKKTRKVEEIVPDAARTVASLRDIGYDTPRAIADLVDNSIEAGASRIDVTFSFAGERSWIRVVDNGQGMDGGTLQEALRYGSEREYGSEDLGKFGFGLKTASTSQCRRVTVASRKAKQNARLEVRCLDLEHIEETSRWEILVLDGADRPEHVTAPLQDHTGTVVLWEDLDRILEYKDPWGEWARKKLFALAEEVDQHLAMVFHRFLAGEVKDHPKLTITINGSTKVEPWDPFCRDEPKTESFPAKDLKVAGDGGVGFVRVSSYVLPQQRDFSSDAAWRRASGPLQWNRQQGLYVYRANRMIQSGGWNRIRAQDEHTKLARMSLDFFPNLDAVFGINIAKAYVTLPDDLRKDLQPLIAQCTRSADQKYRNERPKSGTGGSAAVPSRSSRSTRSSSGGAEFGTGPFDPYGNRQDRPMATRKAPREAIEEVADRVGETAALKKIVGGLRARHPEVARELGW